MIVSKSIQTHCKTVKIDIYYSATTVIHIVKTKDGFRLPHSRSQTLINFCSGNHLF